MRNERDIPTAPYERVRSNHWWLAQMAFWFLLPSAIVLGVIIMWRLCHP